jgi:uracil-DNA glycosylase family 4
MHPSDLRPQIKHRLDSLAAAGVEFLPAMSPVPIAVPVPEMHRPAPTSLFETVPLRPPVDSRQELSRLANEVAGCDKCTELYSTRTQTVFGVGNPKPEIVFVGEAPGGDEDKQGEPFVGKAGQLLNRIIEKAGLKREDIYICNVLKCRPPNNRKPHVDECRNCRPFLDRQLELLAPRVILCLGGVAANSLLGNTTGITRLRGQLYDYNGIPLVCTYHPSYLLRAEGTQDERKLKFECWDDVKLMLKQIGRTVPG